MTFIKKTEPKRTCKDFKPSFWDRNSCKLTEICNDTGRHMKEGFGFCSGIEYPKLKSPMGLESGVSIKSGHSLRPKTKKSKPKTRPKITKNIRSGLTD